MLIEQSVFRIVYCGNWITAKEKWSIVSLIQTPIRICIPSLVVNVNQCLQVHNGHYCIINHNRLSNFAKWKLHSWNLQQLQVLKCYENVKLHRKNPAVWNHSNDIGSTAIGNLLLYIPDVYHLTRRRRWRTSWTFCTSTSSRPSTYTPLVASSRICLQQDQNMQLNIAG